ncbi:hypothetical protein NPIL_298091 [Nephila pilipes]|uniref:Uncharacterized protein n=1 Tax=Nephila pilipes TaxID=299642 RepID=A0A8X6PQ56_NEPPI|nr:hypothetical protein NPIL_298091 [Nephila pilipes]
MIMEVNSFEGPSRESHALSEQYLFQRIETFSSCYCFFRLDMADKLRPTPPNGQWSKVHFLSVDDKGMKSFVMGNGRAIGAARNGVSILHDSHLMGTTNPTR